MTQSGEKEKGGGPPTHAQINGNRSLMTSGLHHGESLFVYQGLLACVSAYFFFFFLALKLRWEDLRHIPLLWWPPGLGLPGPLLPLQPSRGRPPRCCSLHWDDIHDVAVSHQLHGSFVVATSTPAWHRGLPSGMLHGTRCMWSSDWILSAGTGEGLSVVSHMQLRCIWLHH